MAGSYRRGYQDSPLILHDGLLGSLLETSIGDADIAFRTEFTLYWGNDTLTRCA